MVEPSLAASQGACISRKLKLGVEAELSPVWERLLPGHMTLHGHFVVIGDRARVFPLGPVVPPCSVPEGGCSEASVE